MKAAVPTNRLSIFRRIYTAHRVNILTTQLGPNESLHFSAGACRENKTSSVVDINPESVAPHFIVRHSREATSARCSFS